MARGGFGRGIRDGPSLSSNPPKKKKKKKKGTKIKILFKAIWPGPKNKNTHLISFHPTF
jgi:hypothetical protein